MATYDRGLIERLLPEVWDQNSAWGMDNPYPPDPDMPRATVIPKWGGILLAHLADIRRAWTFCVLPWTERKALLLIGGMGLHPRLAGVIEDADSAVMSRRYELGIGRMSDYLNGTNYYKDMEDDD